MRTNKIANAILLVIMLITISALGNKKTVAAENYIILPNGNWDFNYVSTVDTDGYYQALSGVADSAFTSKLSDIITANSVKITYGGKTNNTGDRLRYTDESPRDPSKVLLLYSGNDLEKSKLNQSSKWTWNQEHTWAKSHGFPAESYNAYSDLHHLRPTYEYINSTRSNLDFGEVEDYGGTVKTEDLYGSKVISNAVFEPRDAVKGDVARIMFYMDVRYAGRKSGDPTLTLSYSTKTSGSSGNGEFGNLGTLLKWHNEDPVDDMELRRNDRIQEIQGNRNPFIDRPEFIEQVYGVAYTGTPGGGGTDPNPDPEVDQRKADDVITLINGIGTVTLASEAKISQALAKYNSLTSVQKALVTNYSILQAAIAELNELKNNQVVEESYYTDFSDFASRGYTKNVREEINGFAWLFSNVYKDSNDLRLGNNEVVTLDSRFGDLSKTDGSSMEMQWDINNIKKVKFTFGGAHGTIEDIALYTSVDHGLTYELVAQMKGNQSELDHDFIYPVSGRIALVVTGTKPRLVVNDVSISVGEPLENPLINQVIEAINSLSEAVCTEQYSNRLNEITSWIDGLTSAEQDLISNIDLFFELVDDFDILANEVIEEVNEAINNCTFAELQNIEEHITFVLEMLEDYGFLEDRMVGLDYFYDFVDTYAIYTELVDFSSGVSNFKPAFNQVQMEDIKAKYESILDSTEDVEIIRIEELLSAYEYVNANPSFLVRCDALLELMNEGSKELLSELYSTFTEYEKEFLTEDEIQSIEELIESIEEPISLDEIIQLLKENPALYAIVITIIVIIVALN